MNAKGRHRIVVAGQVPPPVHGQALYLAQTAEMLRDGGFVVDRLPFRFSRSLGDIRRPRPGKLLEVIRVWWRLLRLRMRGPVDLLLFPAGGPQRVPLIRDLLLLPVCRLFARRVVIVFHAGGIAEALPSLPGWLARGVKRQYSRATGAIVLTEAGRPDATATGICQVKVVPNGLPDAFDASRIPPRGDGLLRLLYVGHLCPDKGTPELLAAMARLREDFPGLRLTLVGEASNPWADADVANEVNRLDLADCVTLAGMLAGEAKWRAFAEADAFVFPSHAPYEGFPLALLEAMMWRLPVAASRWRGIPEVLGDGPGAWIESPFDAEAVANALHALVERLQEWPTLGAANRARYEAHFRLESIQERLCDTITAFLDRAR